MESFAASAERPVEVVMGAALTVDRQAFEAVGGWDDGYFFGYEDADLCLRLAQAGYRCLFTPFGEIAHHSGAATKRMPRRRAAYLPGLFRFLRRSRGQAVTAGFKMLFMPLYLARLYMDVPLAAGRVVYYGLTGRRRRARRAARLLLQNLRALTVDLWRMALW
jgi:GT2 family glycosyltransferase